MSGTQGNAEGMRVHVRDRMETVRMWFCVIVASDVDGSDGWHRDD